MSEIIEIKGTDEYGHPLDDKHCFLYREEVIAEILCPMVCPSIGDKIVLGYSIYRVNDILILPEKNEILYYISWYNSYLEAMVKA